MKAFSPRSVDVITDLFEVRSLLCLFYVFMFFLSFLLLNGCNVSNVSYVSFEGIHIFLSSE